MKELVFFELQAGKGKWRYRAQERKKERNKFEKALARFSVERALCGKGGMCRAATSAGRRHGVQNWCGSAVVIARAPEGCREVGAHTFDWEPDSRRLGPTPK